MKYIPGPWENDEGTITGRDGAHIAAVSDLSDFPCADVDEMHPEQREDLENQYKGNATLIAASPDLFEALKALVENLDSEEGLDDTDWLELDMARAAIAKAERQSS